MNDEIIQDTPVEIDTNLNLSGPTQTIPYQYSYVPMPEVEKNIDEYIIPELQAPCRSLWSKNVFTFMCSNRNDFGASYIILEKLSPENQVIFDELKQKHPQNYAFDNYRQAQCIQIPDSSQMSVAEISSAFMDLTQHFIPQDVQSKFYLTPENYLIGCGCFDEIPNPDYQPAGEMPIIKSAEDLYKMDEWSARLCIPPTKKVFNKDKMTKTFAEYIHQNNDENRTDFATGNVYDSPYFLQKHLDYIQSQKDNSTQPVLNR